jgi:23S rRNA pseudouridine1911/1915/1917 synthase
VSIITFSATEGEAGRRLDAVVAARFPFLSRSYAGRLIREARVRVNGTARKVAYIVRNRDTVRCEIPSGQKPPAVEPEPIPLPILFEDDHILVLNKPADLVVHPAPGHKGGTLVNALVHYVPHIRRVGNPDRPGIVHRLDKDTSGILIVAKSTLAHEHLSRQFKERRIDKQYLALVCGTVEQRAGIVRAPIGRHPVDRKKMSTMSPRGRPAETTWRTREAFDSVTLLEVRITTGRTHQIRVHCASMGHPILGDSRYGGKKRWKEASSANLRYLLKSVKRQMLHAWRLTCTHPVSGNRMDFESPMPEDMSSLIQALQLSG